VSSEIRLYITERAENNVKSLITRKCVVRDSTECNAGSREQFLRAGEMDGSFTGQVVMLLSMRL